MGIVAACRGKGLSKPFLAGCLNYWEKRGFKTASLYVDQTNHIALHTYRALAYQFIKTIDNKIFMFKPL
jgi:ribosomal protein S18 acetylase RimI-like enzyme